MTLPRQSDTPPASTPSGVRVVAIAPDGTERNITEGVQALYDLVIQSMDWGSHFLSVEDVDPIVELARFCGFKDLEAAESYVEVERRAEKQRKCSHEHTREEPYQPYGYVGDPAHGYVKTVCTECGRERVDLR